MLSVIPPRPEPDASDSDALTAAHEKIANLETALTTARTIGMALGIVMATYKLTDEEAFDMLVVASQNTRCKLREVAETVVLTGQLNWGAAASTG